MTQLRRERLEDLESLAPVGSSMVEHHHQVPWMTNWRKGRRAFAGQFDHDAHRSQEPSVGCLTVRSVAQRWIFAPAGQLRSRRLVIASRRSAPPRTFNATGRIRILDEYGVRQPAANVIPIVQGVCREDNLPTGKIAATEVARHPRKAAGGEEMMVS
jgi:hypothetical protein